MGQTVWIVMVIVVSLVVALILISMMYSTTKKAEGSTIEPIEQGGNTIKIEMCKRLCVSCRNLHGGDCPDWATSGGTGENCMAEGVGVECPPL